MKNKKMKGELPKVRLAEDGTYHVIGPAQAKDRIIKIPSTIDGVAVTQIDSEAFADCSELVEIELPYGLKTIDKQAFLKCQNLLRIDFPESLVRIEEDAFEGCGSLERIYIPSGVKKIGGAAFGVCVGVSEMVVDPKNPIYKSEGNCIIDIADGVIIAGCKNSVIPEDSEVTTIDSGAFWGMPGELKTIAIPPNMMVIRPIAFAMCFGLESVTLFEGLKIIGEGAFLLCPKLNEINLPQSLSYIGACAFVKCYSLKDIAIPSAITVIERETFMGCVHLANVSLPDSIVKIDYSAFKDCCSLERFTIPRNVSYIGKGAFKNCKILDEVVFDNPNGWMVNGQLLDLSSPETVARYLTHDFCDFEWKRVVNRKKRGKKRQDD